MTKKHIALIIVVICILGAEFFIGINGIAQSIVVGVTALGNCSVDSTLNNFTCPGIGTFGSPGVIGSLTLFDSLSNAYAISAPNSGATMTLTLPTTAPVQASQPILTNASGTLNFGAPTNPLSAFACGRIGAANTTSYYLAPAATNATAANEILFTNTTATGPPMTSACSGKNLFVRLGTATTSALVITLNQGISNTATNVTCTIAAAGTACNDTSVAHAFAFSAGVSWSISALTAQATETAADIRAQFTCN